MISDTITPSEIISFWFSPEASKRWFNSTPDFDNKLRDRFLDTYVAAKEGKLDAWQNTPEGALALVILFDQIPLNIFRKQPECFATERQALTMAKHAIEKGFDKNLTNSQKAFLYMPFMHSEDLKDQDLSIDLYDKAGLEANLRFARHHREIVRRFGRFPHRNAILGRESTYEEKEWLESKEAFKG